jgi:hypothetical protein
VSAPSERTSTLEGIERELARHRALDERIARLVRERGLINEFDVIDFEIAALMMLRELWQAKLR